jgi:demethylmenaquinone methyltransferase/2-methoxy-6-polyprenyl-1,4-benzoquinol methylase
VTGEPSFATDPATAAYYDQRAPEYDDWYESTGLFAGRERPGWDAEVAAIVALVAALPPARTVDVACGTGFLTQHLRGFVVGVDQSVAMLARTRARPGAVPALAADALALPFRDGCFDRVFTGHFYGHLPPRERVTFLEQVWRLAPELVVVDSAPRDGVPRELVQERVLNDGSRHEVFKRFLSGPELAAEIGGTVLYDGRWFAAAVARR